ncbi:aklavinone 12-hydroxylase RdmE, partial [Actinosynnema sp. NPDC020468]|uniref:aklavinone 12-hydroxylase RdmE n=1 Tax=Actinosynnema sp. NPDC020468 TaxID=3154488 RepID=UPI0033F5B5F0
MPVLVVGAGLAGLAGAMFLAQRGVEVLLVERRSGTSLFPRAVGQNQRTMELLGFGGIAEDVPVLAPGPARFRVRVAASLPGPTFHEEVSETDAADIGVLSPARLGTAGQDKLEPLLRRRAEELGADLRFDTELVSFNQDDDGVTAVLRGRHDGRTSRVRADYLVAADGNRSGVREALGVDRHGPGGLGHHVSIIFDADLGDLVDPERATLHVLHNEHADGVFVTVDHAIGRHLYSIGDDPAGGRSPEDFTTERCTELIRLITELPDLEPEIRAVRPWEMAAAVAARFRVGRVLLAGDAAKVTPPSGGFGGNTAVGDAYDLAWKLAAVLDSTAGAELLDTYDAERRPIAERVVAEALRLTARRGPAPTAEDTTAEQPSDQQRAVELTLGFRYRSASVLTEDDDPADTEDPYRPTGRPGFRAPHVWLHRNGARLSTVDLFGHGFVLLTGPEGGFWTDAADDTATRLGTTLRTHAIGDELADTDDEFLTRYGIRASGASLIRPDGVVAWRTVNAAAGSRRSPPRRRAASAAGCRRPGRT